MASFNDILGSNKPRIGQPCATGMWRATLSSADRAEFDAALANQEITGADIHRAMKAMGYEFGDSALKRHRAGGCKCSQTN
jgi:hypothetical protein